ncbi:MAG: hypothetical protein LBP32_01790 [Spirochaetaceae bacterium]|jgi:hypothetical protein|nr:hypothetical protein [Spirochaetaceae bacterium]
MKKKAWCFLLFLAALGFFAFADGEEEDTDETYDYENYTRKPLLSLPEGIGGENDRLDITFGLGLGFIGKHFYFDGVIRMDYDVGPFTLVADLSTSNDQKYAPARVMNPSGNLGGLYFMLEEGGASYHWKGLNLQAGRFRLYDIVDSPYSLYINSLGHASNTLNFRYESARFIYDTRWVELNSRSEISTPGWDEYHRAREQGILGTGIPPDPGIPPGTLGFPDRGMNYKIYALKVRDSRFGFLDATVYTERSFDLEYFLNPIPQYFIQYVKGTPGRPWTTDSNENNMIGFFWDTKNPVWTAYTQILVDDFSLRFISDYFSDNPWKAAWALGGGIQTRIGRFGFHHGGAFKYTFEPITSPIGGRYDGDIAKTAYGYTYYPETRYYDDENDKKVVSILIEDNMLGYKHGENNIAFQVDYQNTFYKILLNAELEFVLAGNNSPANPWQDYTHRSDMPPGKRGTKILDEGPLEKHIELRLNLSHRRGPWTFLAATALGGRFNRLTLMPAVIPKGVKPEDQSAADHIYIWKTSGEHEFIFRISIGAKYTLSVL